jgi:RNA polymerase sigma-70 factor, ECF subfamily
MKNLTTSFDYKNVETVTQESNVNNRNAEIVELLKAGNPKSIDLLFENYYNYLCGVAFRMIEDNTYAEDIVQDLLLNIWNKRENLDINISLGAYLKRATINRSLNYLRSNHSKLEDSISPPDVISQDKGSQDIMEQTELESQIHKIIEQLSPKCKIVFKMSRFEEMTYQEIAETLSLSVKTVENHIAKALKILRISLQPLLREACL